MGVHRAEARGRGVRRIVLRHGLTVEEPLAAAVAFFEAYGAGDRDESPNRFTKADLRRANGGGARISAAEQAAILARRREIDAALTAIPLRASLASKRVPWAALTRLFDAFADIRGIGLSKLTKTLHPKRPALVPMLDSYVQEYLGEPAAEEPFAARATALVRSYKVDLDRNHAALAELQRQLAGRGYRSTEVRLLDLLIWSAVDAARRS
jgi:Family of unknown function (DUF6308)